ncbi:TMEM175 family protein [Trinickia fusca]|uniref:DUF1211 domain-containing protein n=1 Tax=Trinickia fusca TaxID=2419777 RepID=A0A494XCW9_9BURK|nr:TMEM175 family protein [Trinickia fusca]RKP45994.1 DUF1211 domain-containing protein [Trinickia fusca]
MEKNRLEAFSDGVMAVIITIMVLELKVPHGQDLSVLAPLWSTWISYVLSFIYVGIYWNNHHHMLQVVRSVNGGILWTNLHLLFWLSLLPFTTGWMGENHFARWPTMLYGFDLLACAVAWYLLQTCLIEHHGADSLLARAVRGDAKLKLSVVLYFGGLGAAGLGWPTVGILLFAIVALFWIVPDRRMERALAEAQSKRQQ